MQNLLDIYCDCKVYFSRKKVNELQYKIKKYRLKMGMTQEELSKKSGVSRITISGLESGKEMNVSVKILKRIAECLEVSINDLFY